MEGSASRAEPSALKPEIVEGPIFQARTLHENALHHGRFNVQSGTLRAEARNRGRFHSPGLNPPRFRPESRTVRCKQNQPSTRRLDITDGPCLRSAPSMLMLHIADGSILQTRTFHDNASYHGWFSIQVRTLHALGLNHGQFDVNRTNLPRGDSISRTVPFSKTEPSTKTPRIMEGSASRAEPSALRSEIVEGSYLRSAPSMLMLHFTDGSILQDRTLHENAAHHGRFSIQSGTIRAEARNRGRFHFPDPSSRPVLQARTPPLSDPVPSIQYAGWHGTYH